MLAEIGGHPLTPQFLSMRDKHGEPRFGLYPLDYPVPAVCLECGEPVSCASAQCCPGWTSHLWGHDSVT